MSRILLFGGTTEGREEALRRMKLGDEVLVCVTSSYARALLPTPLPCHVGIMDSTAMKQLAAAFRPDLLVDATHPFARLVTENLRHCAQSLGLPYQRIERAGSSDTWADAVEWVVDSEAAALALTRTEGPVFLTTGSHTLKDYTAVIPVERLYVRVLPTQEALRLCSEAGMPPSHVLAMQGPFSPALNGAVMDMWHIGVMVSKDSGKNGGVDEKVLPALERGIHVIMIRRPTSV